MNRDTAFALGMLIFTAVAFAETFRFPEGSPFRVGPAVYPRYILAVTGGLSAILLVRSLVNGGTLGGLSRFDSKAFLAHYWRSGAIFAIFAVYAAVLPIIGFPIATAVFLIVLQLLLTPLITVGRLALIGAIGIGATGFIYVVFTEVLRIFLP